ncbi:MAG: DNA-directed RNA polymerase subunit alpha C-terminal domain-containing protein [Elainellaceae cyanobacterium]
MKTSPLTTTLQWFDQPTLPLELLQLHVQTYLALKRARITSVNDLLHYTSSELSTIPGITPDRLLEITSNLRKQLDLTLPSSRRSPSRVYETKPGLDTLR